MSSIKIFAGLAVTSLWLGGCSSPGPTEPDFDSARRYDIEKIRQIEKEAYQRDVEVIWVNLPQAKRTLEPVDEQQTTETE